MKKIQILFIPAIILFGCDDLDIFYGDSPLCQSIENYDSGESFPIEIDDPTWKERFGLNEFAGALEEYPSFSMYYYAYAPYACIGSELTWQATIKFKTDFWKKRHREGFWLEATPYYYSCEGNEAIKVGTKLQMIEQSHIAQFTRDYNFLGATKVSTEEMKISVPGDECEPDDIKNTVYVVIYMFSRDNKQDYLAGYDSVKDFINNNIIDINVKFTYIR